MFYGGWLLMSVIAVGLICLGFAAHSAYFFVHNEDPPDEDS